jgi:hypothetical protein
VQQCLSPVTGSAASKACFVGGAEGAANLSGECGRFVGMLEEGHDREGTQPAG